MSALHEPQAASGEETPAILSRPSSRSSHTIAASEDDLERGSEKGEESPQSSTPASIDEKEPVRTIHGLRWLLVCASIYIAAFTYGLDTTIAADIQSSVVETFGDVQQISWLGTGFLLGSVSTILPVGNLYERFNIKWNFLIGILLFEVGSAICGAAPNMDALIIGRVVAGVGGSGVYLGALNYFSVLTVPTERGGYIAAIGLFWGIGAVLGPIIGGAFAESAATWRWAFYINLVIAAVCAPVYLTMPGYQPMPDTTRTERLRGLDWLGIFLNGGTWVAFTILFSFAGAQWAWNSAPTIALFVVLGVLLLSFIAQQAYAIGTTKTNRLVPVHLLFSRTQVLLAIATAASTSAMFVPIYFIPIYFQFVHGDSAIQAAIRLLPFLVVSMGVNLAVGTLIPKIKIYAVLYLVSGILIVAGSAPLYTWTPATSMAQIYGLSVIIAFGAGLIIQAGYTIAGVKVTTQNRPHDVAHSIALQNIAQIGGGAIALIVAGQVFQSTAFSALSEALSGLNLPEAEIRAAVAGTQSKVFETLDAEAVADAIFAITRAMANVWMLALVAGVVLMISSVFMRWERLF